MSLEESEVAKIQTLALQKKEGMPENELDEWIKNPEYIIKCKSFLESPNTSPAADFIILLALNRLITDFYETFTIEDQNSHIDWMINNLLSNIGRFLDLTSLNEYSKLIGYFISRSWDLNPHMEEAFQQILSQFMVPVPELTMVGIIILQSIAEYTRKMEITTIHENYYHIIYEKAADIMRDIGNYEGIILEKQNAILGRTYSLIHELLRYDGKTKYYEITLPLDCKNILNKTEFVDLIFDTCLLEPGVVTTHILIDIFVKLCKLSSSNFPTYDSYKEFMGHILQRFSQEDFPPQPKDCTQFFINLINTLRKNSYINKAELITFAEKITIYCLKDETHEIIRKSSTISDLVSFWSSIEEIQPEYVYNIIYSFIEAVLEAIAIDRTTIEEYVPLKQNYHPIFNSIAKLSAKCYFEYLKVLYDMLVSGKEALSKAYNECSTSFDIDEARLCFIITLVTSTLCNGPITNDLIPFYGELLFELFSLIDVHLIPFPKIIDETLNISFPKEPKFEIIKAFLIFMNNMQKIKVLNNFDDNSRELFIFLKEKGITSSSYSFENFEATLSFLFDQFKKLFLCRLPKEFLIGAINTLGTYLDPDGKLSKIVFTNEFISSLPYAFCNTEIEFPFFSDPEYLHERFLFHTLVYKIIMNRGTGFTISYLHGYDDYMKDIVIERVIGVLCDFTGFFKVADKKGHHIFFDYAINSMFRNIIDKATEIHNNFEISPKQDTNVLFFQSLLKMWSIMVKNEPNRIVFKQHSGYPVLLLRFTSELIRTMTEFITEQMNNGNKPPKIIKLIKYCFSILVSLLKSSYLSPPVLSFIAAFNETSINSLITCFYMLTSNLMSNDLDQNAKFEMILQELIQKICERHMQEAIKVPDCTRVMLLVINHGLYSQSVNVMTMALNAMKTFILNIGEIGEDEKQNMERIFCLLWGKKMSGKLTESYAITECIRPLMLLLDVQSSLAYLNEKLLKFALPDKEQLISERIVSFLQSIADEEQNTIIDGPQFVNCVNDFVKNVKPLIKSPMVIFM